MKDYAKLVILGSSALLVLLAVFLMLYLSYPREDNNAQAQNDKPGEGAKPPAGPGETKPPEEIARPDGGHTAGLPDNIEPGKDVVLTLPCKASIVAVVQQYYKSTKLSDGTPIPIKPEKLPAVSARLAKFNNVQDPNADLETGTVIRLPNVYIVVPGDKLESIAKRVYNDRKQWQAIQGLNMDVVPDATKMKPGIVLILP
jgi:nucleoid-associated protein YgaU